jgi:hypothetical protein
MLREHRASAITSEVIAAMTCSGDAGVYKEADLMILTAHRAVLIDAAATAAAAALMFAVRPLLYPYFGLTSPMLLDVTAAAFIAYAAIIALAALRPVIPRGALMTIVGANVAYVAASLAVLVVFWSQLHPVGRGLIVAVALAVELFATLQFVAARRAPSASAQLA